MKEFFKKLSDSCKLIFGYGIMISLFLGVVVFLGYMVALILGGETAVGLCNWIYKTLVPFMVYLSTASVLLGLVAMYLAGESALTSGKKKKS